MFPSPAASCHRLSSAPQLFNPLTILSVDTGGHWFRDAGTHILSVNSITFTVFGIESFSSPHFLEFSKTQWSWSFFLNFPAFWAYNNSEGVCAGATIRTVLLIVCSCFYFLQMTLHSGSSLLWVLVWFRWPLTHCNMTTCSDLHQNLRFCTKCKY